MEGFEEFSMEDLIDTLVTVIETNNLVLNTYHGELEAGAKKQMVEKMIGTNSQALISLMSFINVKQNHEVHISGMAGNVPMDVQESMAKMIAMAMNNPLPDEILKAHSLLEELRDASVGSHQQSIIEVLRLLKYGNSK